MTDPYVQQTDLHTSDDPMTASGSTTDVVKTQGRQVAGDAAEGGKKVAQVAAGEAGSVAHEATDQVRSLLGQAGSQLSTQAADQKEALVSWLRTLSDEFESMAGATSSSGDSEGQQSTQPGVATNLAERGADLAHRTASWLEDREPSAVLNDVGAFARRRPGMFLAIAATAGVVVGRLTRGLAAGPIDHEPRHAALAPTFETAERNGGYSAEPTWSAPAPAVDLGESEVVPTTPAAGYPPAAGRGNGYPEAGQ